MSGKSVERSSGGSGDHAVSIPISMGYAQIAGLPAVYGLYGSVFPIVLFALFSTSPQFVFGVDAAPAATGRIATG